MMLGLSFPEENRMQSREVEYGSVCLRTPAAPPPAALTGRRRSLIEAHSFVSQLVSTPPPPLFLLCLTPLSSSSSSSSCPSWGAVVPVSVTAVVSPPPPQVQRDAGLSDRDVRASCFGAHAAQAEKRFCASVSPWFVSCSCKVYK